MKKYITAALLFCAALTAACSKETAGSADTGDTGALEMRVSATRAEADGEYDPLQRLAVRIYHASGELLRQTVGLLREHGYTIGNIDATVLAQAPKMKPHIPAMRQRIAALCGIGEGQVSIKATTEEGLGFTGQKEGIAAHAVCLITQE